MLSPKGADARAGCVLRKISWVIGVHLLRCSKVTLPCLDPSVRKSENKSMKILTFVQVRWDRRGSHLPRKGSFAARVVGGFSFPTNARARVEAVRRAFYGRVRRRQELPTEEELRDLF